MKQSKTSLKDISVIGCNIGPGSFTGLRIGLSFVRTLAEELKTKLFVSNSFYMCLTHFLYNKNYLNNKITIIILLSAVKSEVYYKKFVLDKNFIIKSSANQCIKKSELDLIIKNNHGVYIIGNAIDEQTFISTYLKKQNIIKTFPKAKDLIKIFLNTNLYTTVSTKNLSPLYIRHTYY